MTDNSAIMAEFVYVFIFTICFCNSESAHSGLRRDLGSLSANLVKIDYQKHGT